MSKQIILSDTHLGYRQYGFLKREEDFEKSFQIVVDAAIADPNVNAMFNAGDCLNVKRPTSRTVQFLVEIDAKLRAAKKTMYIISGNHDYSKPSWVDTIKTKADAAGDYGLKNFDYKTVTIDGKLFQGLPEMSKEEYIKYFETLKGGHALFIHAPIREFIKYPSESVLQATDLPTDKFKFIFVGDTHVTEQVKVDDCMITSPGATEMNSSSENPQKYYFVLEDTKLEQVPLKTRPIVHFNPETEDDLIALLAKKKELEKKGAILFIDYNSAIQNALSKINLTFNQEKVIVRPRARFRAIKLKDTVKKAECVSTKPEEYLEMFTKKNQPEFNLLSSLVSDKEGANDIVDNYIDERTTALA